MVSKPKSGKKLLWFIIPIAIVLIVVVFFLLSSSEKVSDTNVIDCGTNTLSLSNQGSQQSFDCFISASKTCEPAKLLNTIKIEIFGLSTTLTTYMELKGMDSGKCVYYEKIESDSVEFGDALRQKMLSNGLTEDEIKKQEQDASKSAQDSVGIEQTCKFEPSKLTSVLTNWKGGNFNGGVSCTLNPNGTPDCEYSGDFANADCVASRT